MGDKELNELLDKIFSNVNLWLSFAETKNAANIALVVACVAAIFSLGDTNVFLYSICILFIFSGICSMLSFFPKLGTIMAKRQRATIDPSDNLIFFEAIQKYSGQEYMEQVSKLYFNNNQKNFSKYQLDLANEIVYNSGIASYKYKLFKVAARVDVAAFTLLIFGLGWMIFCSIVNM